MVMQRRLAHNDTASSPFHLAIDSTIETRTGFLKSLPITFQPKTPHSHSLSHSHPSSSFSHAFPSTCFAQPIIPFNAQHSIIVRPNARSVRCGIILKWRRTTEHVWWSSHVLLGARLISSARVKGKNSRFKPLVKRKNVGTWGSKFPGPRTT